MERQVPNRRTPPSLCHPRPSADTNTAGEKGTPPRPSSPLWSREATMDPAKPGEEPKHATSEYCADQLNYKMLYSLLAKPIHTCIYSETNLKEVIHFVRLHCRQAEHSWQQFVSFLSCSALHSGSPKVMNVILSRYLCYEESLGFSVCFNVQIHWHLFGCARSIPEPEAGLVLRTFF